MNRSLTTRFLIFALLFIGTVEAAAPVDKSVNDKITVSGSYNPFSVSTCSTTDRYVQGSAKVNYDKRFHKNWEFHSAAAYSRSKQISHYYNSDDPESDPPLPEYKNGGYGDVGFSFWWDYLRVRADFTLFVWDEYVDGKKDGISVMPMGGGLIEAGKMDFLWISTGCLHHDYPYGFLQIALNGNIRNKAEFGGGFVFFPENNSTFKADDGIFSIFLRTKAPVNDFFALKAYLGFKPMYVKHPALMFEGSLGMEFSF